VTTWCFNSSLRVLRLDVAASNLRAIRCYEKVGFVKVGETWRQAPDLVDADLAAARYDFLRPHVRTDKPIPELRFWLMEFVEHGVAGFRGNAQSNADKGRCYV
jgi:RimJ/RimL family protein N-acetyltransferase